MFQQGGWRVSISVSKSVSASGWVGNGGIDGVAIIPVSNRKPAGNSRRRSLPRDTEAN